MPPYVQHRPKKRRRRPAPVVGIAGDSAEAARRVHRRRPTPRIHDESRTVRVEKRDRETRDFPTARPIRLDAITRALQGQKRIHQATMLPGGHLKPLGTAINLGAKAAGQLGTSIVYSPAGVYQLGKATGLDVRDIATGRDMTPSRTKRLGKEIGRQVAEDIRHPGRNPGYLAMDIAAALSVGAGGAARVGAVGRAAAAGRGVGRVTGAIARKPSEGGSLLRAPAPGRVEIAPGVHVRLSRNALVRAAQRARIKRQQRRPEGVMRGIAGLNRPRNLPERIGHQRRRQERIREDIERANAEGLRARARKLDRVEQTAVRVVGEGVPIAKRIAAHRRDMATATSKVARRRLRRKIALLHEVERRGLVDNVNGRPRPSAKLEDVYESARQSGARREATLEEMGLLTREQAELRRAAPARVIEGAEYQRTRARPGRKEHVREYEVGTRRVERPRTEAEARERLAELDQRYDEIVREVEDTLTGGQPADVADVARRNLHNLRSTGRRRGRPRMQTVKQELRALAEEQLDRIIAARPNDPHVKALAGLMAERRALREALNEPERVFGAAAERTGEFGRVAYELPARTIRRRFSAQEPRRASAGLVGAEDVEPGELFVSYASRRRLPTGRMQAGTAQGIGTPRGNVLHGAYTGASFHTGHFPDKAVRLIADDELEAQRFRSVIRIRNSAVQESIGADEYLRLPERVRDHYIPVRVTGKPFTPDTREFLDRMQRKLDEGERLSRRERKELERRVDTARARIFPDLTETEALAEAAKGQVRFVDERTLGGLNRQEGLYGAIGAAATGADELNAATQVAVLFLKPAYLTPNLFGQGFLTLAQQGVLAPWNMAKAVELYRKLTPEERAKVRAASGLGLAKALPTPRASRVSRTVRNFLARQWSRALDSPFRWAAFVHEARLAGYGTPARIRALITDEANLDDLLEVAQRTREAMVDYTQMAPWEEKFARRAVFFYPWLKGSAMYTGRFARDHPVQAAALVQLGREGHEKALRELGPVPWFARGMFKVGEDAQGRPLVVNPRAAQLFDSPVQFAEAVRSLVSGDVEQTGAEFEDLLSPAGALPGQLLYPHDPLGGYQLPRREALKREYLESLPQYRLLEKTGIPGVFPGKSTKNDPDVLYPTGPREALAQFGVGGVYPRPVNPKELAERARAEGRANLSSDQRAYRDVFANRDEMFTEVRERMPDLLEDGQLPEELRGAWNNRAAYRREYERLRLKLDKEGLDPIERFQVAARVMVQAKKWTAEKAALEVKETRRLPEKEIERRKNWLLREALGGFMLTYIGGQLRLRGGSFELD